MNNKLITDETLNEYMGIPGVWAVYEIIHNKRIFLNVAETENIGNEISTDINFMKSELKRGKEYPVYNNFGEYLFSCPNRYWVRKYTWKEIGECSNIEFICIARDIEDRKFRRKIEKYIAYKTRAKYWRDRRCFIPGNEMDRKIEQYIKNFEASNSSFRI